jgi:hypothetical protein
MFLSAMVAAYDGHNSQVKEAAACASHMHALVDRQRKQTSIWLPRHRGRVLSELMADWNLWAGQEKLTAMLLQAWVQADGNLAAAPLAMPPAACQSVQALAAWPHFAPPFAETVAPQPGVAANVSVVEWSQLV